MSDLQTMDVVIKWRDTQEVESVTLARIPYEWRDKLDKHPQDEAIFYWLNEQQWHLIGHEAFTNEEWELVELNGNRLDPDTGVYEGECDKCANTYELSDRTNRCGDCGNCNNCCTHEREGK